MNVTFHLCKQTLINPPKSDAQELYHQLSVAFRLNAYTTSMHCLKTFDQLHWFGTWSHVWSIIFLKKWKLRHATHSKLFINSYYTLNPRDCPWFKSVVLIPALTPRYSKLSLWEVSIFIELTMLIRKVFAADCATWMGTTCKTMFVFISAESLLSSLSWQRRERCDGWSEG